MKKTRREFLKTLGATAVGAGAMMSGMGVVHSQAKPIVVGCPVPRASAYGQNGERGMILACRGDQCCGRSESRQYQETFKARNH